ncbi:hypothetical protein U1Q18_027200 [Sarracenia purpurea var. burkii]
MECNKDEAAKAKGIAEKKLVEGDIPAAKKFALKAHKTFPELEGLLRQFMVTLDVYIFADKHINGEVDSYGVLGVDPLADDEMLKKQFRKLAPIIHPNKNKSVGANTAFKMLSEAWSLLSDKSKRAAYDQKRNLTIYQTGNSSMWTGKNGFQTFTPTNNSIVQKSAANHQPTPNAPVPPRPSKLNTFWIACSQCKMEYDSGKGDRPLKIGRIEANVTGREMPNQMARENGEIDQGIVSGYQKRRSSIESIRALGTIRNISAREFSRLEICNLLMARSRMEILKKLNEWSVAAALKSSLATSNVDSDEKKAGEVVSMNVPDSDYYDFDKDRIEKSFGKNQVCAAYDDEDGMPRHYALIHNVISERPFKMQISWLNSKSNAEFGPLNWVGSGFTKTTGDFRIGRYQIFKNLNSFSHKVKWTKGRRGVVQIFPKKGDDWALYKNWSAEWNELTPNEAIQKYDMTIVLQDYNEEQGVTVVPLISV